MDYVALQAENQTLRVRTTELEEQLVGVREELAELKRLVFGSKRERFIGSAGEGQLSLLADEAPMVSAISQKQPYQRTVAKPPTTTSPSRKLLPPHLPRVEIVLEPDVDTATMKKIGEQVSEELDYQPAKLFVRRYVRP